MAIMNARKLFTEHELSILKVLWGAKEPLTRPQLLERMREMNPASFHVAMNSLMEKGYVGIGGFERCGAGYGRAYAARKTREEFVLHVLRMTQPEDAAPEEASQLMLAFVEHTPMDEATLSELEAILAQRRRNMRTEANEKRQEKE